VRGIRKEIVDGALEMVSGVSLTGFSDPVFSYFESATTVCPDKIPLLHVSFIPFKL